MAEDTTPTTPSTTDVTAAASAAEGTYRNTTVLDSHVAENANPDLLLSDIDKKVLLLNPSSTPLDQITRYASNKPCSAFKVEHYALERQKESTTLATAHAKGTSARVTLDVKDDIFDVTDCILVPSIKMDDESALMLTVVALSDEGKPIVMAVNGDALKDSDLTIPPAIPANTMLVRMGRSAGELDVQSPAIEALPSKEYNYCQIFKAQIEAGKLYEKMAKEVDWNFSDQEENAMYEFRRGMEYSFMFGQRGKIYDTATKQNKWFCGGIWNQAGKQFDYEVGSLNKNNFVDICKLAFVGNNGSNQRILLGGSGLIAEISKLDVDKVQHSKETEVVFGITFNKIVTNFGTLLVLFDEIFDKKGAPGDGFILDPQFLSKRVFQPLGKLDLDMVKSGNRNTDARVITEISCPILKYPDAHMRIVCTPKTN